ncbi:hypothetical protein [Sporomusa acidovorans]|uniref:Outer membrane protein beta-barrel domain-containing protein n=1 Tax=Sporomusa acidovorans (strain ATCC 49682 / DSM 3132 / Mol) TaxID=1123286 RepID=A0ABZ3J756_SPOA4|nr:hypothetical protein [Sporomusa acidovorans]OZC24206.1 hypothetical protein SPACI_01460 [Sporomusa acidovorans DSM 3132]SDF77188.1 hypothetical protein SAMN04488499_108011 [Sporomusa acidovorans]
MKKTAILAMTTAAILTASVGLAAPLTDYSKGKTSIDVTWRQSDINAKSQLFNDDLDKQDNLDYGITTGLGNKFAVQYNYYNAKSKDTTFSTSFVDSGTYEYKENGSLKTQEFNVLYKIDKALSAYVGVAQIKGTMYSDGYDFTSGKENKLQFGLIGSAKLFDKTTAYAQVGVASDFYKWKLGVSQEIAPNLELNVDYSRAQAKNMNFDGGVGAVDITTKGLGFGLSLKF